jgi:transposase
MVQNLTKGTVQMKITTIGIDLAKNVFAIHGVDGNGKVVVQRTLRRAQVLPFFRKLEPCLIGMEACATAHHWARKLMELGHEVGLMPPLYVKAYVKRGKSDRIDAGACCEAVTRPTMRFVPVKSEEQQGFATLHRARAALVQQKSRMTNIIRSLCAEFGVVVGKSGLPQEITTTIADESDERLPADARFALQPLLRLVESLRLEIGRFDREIAKRCQADADCIRLQTIPGIGPITASALVAIVGDVKRFKCGRDLAAWVGLTPKANATGGKNRCGPISKRGNRYLRSLFVQGAASIVKRAHDPRARNVTPALRKLLARKKPKVAVVAHASRMARIAWAVLAKNEDYTAAYHQKAAA